MNIRIKFIFYQDLKKQSKVSPKTRIEFRVTIRAFTKQSAVFLLRLLVCYNLKIQ